VSDKDQFKRQAAARAVAQIEDGMRVGLGTGSTAAHAVALLGQRVAQEGLRVTAVPTSERTAQQARGLHIPLSTLEQTPSLDIAIDGADEIDTATLHLIKGAGGALLREKLVEITAARLLIIADDSKVVARLGTHFPVPVEVTRFGWSSTRARLEALGCDPTLRRDDQGDPYLTDEDNYILDCAFAPIADAAALADKIKGTCGVIEHGLFINMATQAIVAGPNGIQVYTG
jgi:ribose 5-phosphate isomerase A